MKTYPIQILRQAFYKLFDTRNYVVFSVYTPKTKSLKFKGIIAGLYANSSGLKVTFKRVWHKRERYFNIAIPMRNIRWLSNPFDEQKFEDLCRVYIKKLEAPKEVSGITSSETAS